MLLVYWLTWVCRDSGLEVKGYRYFDKKTVGLDFNGLIEDLKVCLQIRDLWLILN